MSDDRADRLNALQRLRTIGVMEGLSFILLMFVAMPLKYAAGMPIAVKIVGWIHGVLFIAFCFALTQAHMHAEWPISRSVKMFVAALLPFGPFVMDKSLKEEMAQP